MIFVSSMFLFNKTNPLLNNDFVKQHTKSAFIIHLGFLMSYLIFIFYWLADSIQIFGFSMNVILASAICIVLFLLMLFAIYKANKWEYFSIWEILTIKDTTQSFWFSQQDTQLEERDKLTLFLSYIPFIWAYIYTQNRHNIYVEHASRLNTFMTVVFILLFAFGLNNLALAAILVYIIYIVFVSTYLFINNTVFQIHLPLTFSAEKKYIFTHAIGKYLKHYFSGKDIQSLSHYYSELTQIYKQKEELNLQNINKLKNYRFPKIFLYIPGINIFFFFARKTNMVFHYTNGVIISILFFLSLGILNFTWMPGELFFLFLLIMIFGFGYSQTRIAYQMPYIYMFYIIFEKLLGKSKKFNTTYNVEKSVTLEVKNK